jgi:hypothetical protein
MRSGSQQHVPNQKGTVIEKSNRKIVSIDREALLCAVYNAAKFASLASCS